MRELSQGRWKIRNSRTQSLWNECITRNRTQYWMNLEEKSLKRKIWRKLKSNDEEIQKEFERVRTNRTEADLIWNKLNLRSNINGITRKMKTKSEDGRSVWEKWCIYDPNMHGVKSGYDVRHSGQWRHNHFTWRHIYIRTDVTMITWWTVLYDVIMISVTMHCIYIHTYVRMYYEHSDQMDKRHLALSVVLLVPEALACDARTAGPRRDWRARVRHLALSVVLVVPH